MAKINIKLSPLQQKVLVGSALGLGVGGYLFFAFFWNPISQKITDTSKKVEEIEGKIEKAQRQAARKAQLELELAALNQAAVDAERRLPKKKSVADILVTVGALAQSYHVDLLAFSPGASAAKQFFTELSYPVTVRGSFHNIGRFLAAISLEERIFNVSNVNYPTPTENGDMTVTFTLISYQYKG